jgi:NADH-quinone oxidoreductase subunit L
VEHLIWLIPALPLAGFALLLLFGRRLGEPIAGWLGTAAVAGSFLATVATFLTLHGKAAEHRQITQTLFTWLPVGGLKVNIGFLVDPLSITMCLFVTGVATLIHLYSIGYMHGDRDYSKFFLYLNLFVVSMLVLVLADNLLLTFVGWEGVGACSYWLVSFWFSSEANASAGKKAFITNRIGDVGFMLAMFFTFQRVGTLDYLKIFNDTPHLSTTTATVIAALLFLGACGKSAQLPLYVWLPDAMAGPTPVSALIHAATMVTAGVYLLTRMNPVLALTASWVPWMIAIVGVSTAFFAATIAIAQNDIKKVLAYSTVSQLGYMVLAVGSGAYTAAIFHMITHAFFKALLFLGAGSVIHGMGDEQDMRRMGALRKLMPITAATFIVAFLAISGVPPFSGFFSKDDILLAAYGKSPLLWFVGLVTALLTAFYMGREVFLVFFGKPRWNSTETTEAEQSAAEVADAPGSKGDTVTAHASSGAHSEAQEGHDVHPHESPWQMWVPLAVLAVLAFAGGWINSPFWARGKFLEHWLDPVVKLGEIHHAAPTSTKLLLGAVATATALIGIALAAGVYLKDRRDIAAKIELPFFAKGWLYDATISAFMAGPGRKAFDAIAWFDKHVIDGALNGTGIGVREVSGKARLAQTGYVRTYALGIALGAIVLAALIASKAVF